MASGQPEPSPGQGRDVPPTLDLLTIALLVFFLALIGIVAGLLVLPAIS